MPRLHRLTSLSVFLGIGWWLCSAQALAESDLSTLIKTQLSSHLSANAHIQVFTPESQQPHCPAPELTLTQPGKRLLGRVSLRAQCPDEPPRFVQISISIPVTYWVAKQTIQAGEVVQAEWLEAREGRQEQLPRNIITDLSQLVGLQAVRTLSAGTRMQAGVVRTPWLVERNATVNVEAQGAGFRISREGTALENGSLDGQIRVRTDNGEVIRARITGPNQLQVAL